MAKKLNTSPKGVAVYPHLNSPDVKFKEAGEYHVKLRVPLAEAKPLMKLVDEQMAKALKEALEKAETPKAKKAVKACADKPYSLETDDDDNKTGFVLFSFKMKASGKNKKTGEEWTQRPAIFDAAGQPATDKKLRIGAGSVIRVSFEFNTFWTAKLGAGVSLRMKAVQVIKLVEWGQGNAEYHGFEDEAEDIGPGTDPEAEGGAGEQLDDDDAVAATTDEEEDF